MTETAYDILCGLVAYQFADTTGENDPQAWRDANMANLWEKARVATQAPDPMKAALRRVTAAMMEGPRVQPR